MEGFYVETLKFALANRKVDGTDDKDVEQACNLMRLANKVDHYAASAQEKATYMSEQFARYAKHCAEGRVDTSTPASCSAVVDLVSDAARYEASREALADAFHAFFGKGFKKVREEMKAAAAKAVQP